MTFGVTPEGLVIKRLADIQTELNEDARGVYGNAVDLDPRRPFGQFLGIMSERFAQIWELVEQVYLARYPRTAEGKQFDDVASFNGLVRRAATFSTVGVRLSGTEGTVIPQGTRASVDGNPESIFETDEEYTIEAGINEIQEIIFPDEPVAGAFTLVFGGEATSAIQWDDTAGDIEAALEALSGVSAVTVIGSFYSGFTITFTGADGQQPQSLISLGSNTLSSDGIAVGDIIPTIARVQLGVLPGVDGTMTAQTSGPIPAPAGSLTVREDTVSGWDSITNPLDAEQGEIEETDAAFKIRRAQQIALGALCTPDAIRARMLEVEGVESCVVYINNTEATVDSLPPKSVRVVLLGGDPLPIARQLFASVAGGIRTYGAQSQTITDDSGFPQILRWDNAEEVSIWVEIDLTIDPEDFPLDGEDQIIAAILAYGEGLGTGDDVIVYPYFICTLDVISRGILDAAVRIGTSSGPTLDDNISIAPDEIARFDSSRITINIASS
jgi:uncharacterized phage protein gp47/JayE